MKQSYLLPCTCGQKIPVEATRAGQEVVCQCGRRLEVPTMRKLRHLERAAPPERGRTPSQAWGARQAVILVGSLVILAAMITAAWFYTMRPKMKPIEELTFADTWIIWERDLHPGIDFTSPSERGYLEVRKAYHRWMSVVAAFFVLGVGIVVVGLLMPKRGPRRKGPPPKPTARTGPARR